MIAYLTAENGSSEIQDDLLAQISQRKGGKGKERGVEEEDKRRTKARTASPASIEQDDNGLVYLQLFYVVSFVSNIFLFLI